jgi:hypothetical protein
VTFDETFVTKNQVVRAKDGNILIVFFTSNKHPTFLLQPAQLDNEFTEIPACKNHTTTCLARVGLYVAVIYIWTSCMSNSVFSNYTAACTVFMACKKWVFWLHTKKLIP